MRVMVFAILTEGGPPPSAEDFEAMDRFTEELVEAGVFVAAAGLKPPQQSKRIVILEDGAPVVTDGPFVETKEQIAGFSIWEVKDLDEAVAWGKRSPNPGTMEIRPFYEICDLAEFLSPEELAAGPRQGERGRLGVA